MIEALEERGGDLPDWYLDRPEDEAGDEFYLSAFYTLSTCRPYGLSGGGPIPWTAIIEYARYLKLERDLWQLLEIVVRTIDISWLNWQAEEMKSRSEKGG